MLYTLTYSSVAAFAMSESEVAALLSRSRELNAADGITGLLVHIRLDCHRAAFLQVLEGPRDAVERTYERIERDELHQDLTVLRRSAIEKARFRGWTMKFSSLDEASMRHASDGDGDSDPAVLLRDPEAMARVIFDQVAQP